MVAIRKAWSPNVGFRDTKFVPIGESLAVQSEKDNCDINVIVRRFGVTGQLPVVARPPTYEDFGGVFDFQSAMNMIRASEESFAEMSAEVRKRFNNDPHEFVDFCTKEENLPEMRKLGLAVPEVVEPPVVAPSGAPGEKPT